MSKEYILTEAKKKGFVQGVTFTSLAGYPDCRVVSLRWRGDLLVNEPFGIIYNLKTKKWANIKK